MELGTNNNFALHEEHIIFLLQKHSTLMYIVLSLPGVGVLVVGVDVKAGGLRVVSHKVRVVPLHPVIQDSHSHSPASVAYTQTRRVYSERRSAVFWSYALFSTNYSIVFWTLSEAYQCFLLRITGCNVFGAPYCSP